MKLALIKAVDWFDANVLRHRFHKLCGLICNSSWWGY